METEKQGDLDVVDGEDAYIGPWATWDREHQAGFLDSIEELPEGQAQEEEEEEPEPSVPCKQNVVLWGRKCPSSMQVHDGLSGLHLHASPSRRGTSSCKCSQVRRDLHPKGLRSYMDGPYSRCVHHMALPQHRPPPAQQIYGH